MGFGPACRTSAGLGELRSIRPGAAAGVAGRLVGPLSPGGARPGDNPGEEGGSRSWGRGRQGSREFAQRSHLSLVWYLKAGGVLRQAAKLVRSYVLYLRKEDVVS